MLPTYRAFAFTTATAWSAYAVLAHDQPPVTMVVLWVTFLIALPAALMAMGATLRHYERGWADLLPSTLLVTLAMIAAATATLSSHGERGWLTDANTLTTFCIAAGGLCAILALIGNCRMTNPLFGLLISAVQVTFSILLLAVLVLVWLATQPYRREEA